VTLIVDFGEPLRAGTQRMPQAWLGGLSDTYDLIELGKTHTSLDLKLTPLGACTLLGLPMRELTGAVVGLDDLFGAQGRTLTEQLLEASNWEERFDLLEVFLLARAAEGPEASPSLARAWSWLCSSEGRIPIGRLAAELGMSRRHLASTFHEQVGLPPKTVARLLRFARVRRLLGEKPTSWVEVAHDCGYFDQSHLNRDFRKFAGTTPTDFLARQLPGGGVIGDGISFVQDTATTAT
jgi:AraC-like DNA-binding protein